MTFNDPRRLQSLTDFETLLDYLRDEQGWPIEVEDLDAATYGYTPDELGINPRYAARIVAIKQLRPLVANQVWGIFFVEFDNNRLPVMALRRILQSLAIKSRQRNSSTPAWQRGDLLFICVYTSAAEGKAGQRGITFAHFREERGHPPELRTFSWDSRETHFYYIRNLNLNALRWPANDRDTNAWREQWRSAFLVRHRYTIGTAEKLASQMAKQAAIIRELVEDLYEAESEKGELHVLFNRLKIDLIHDIEPDNFADMIAQTITYGVFLAAVQSGTISLDNLPDFIPDTNPFLKRMLEALTTQGALDLDELGVGQLVDLLSQVDLQALTRDFGRQTGSGQEDPVVHFYEQFLNEYDPEQRVQRGVFYTPDPVVEYIVSAVDQILRRSRDEGGFGITDGLASDATTVRGEPLVQILDPATGTGTFLAHIIDHIAQRKNPRGQPTNGWNDYVAKNLLKRLNGFELMMAPYTIAHLKLGLKLAQTGYTFGTGERLRVFLTNTLEKPVEMSDTLLETDYLSREANEANIVKRRAPIMVVIGNPPYANFGQLNQNDWILGLLEDYKKGLDEKKINLNDDYIKFIRFAQWKIEQTGEGIVAFITNNSFLDGITHRQMRQSLLDCFDAIFILNLRGNSMRSDTTPDGQKDENVFDIRVGVTICVLVKHSHPQLLPQVRYAELTGIRGFKYETLARGDLLDSDWKTIDSEAARAAFIPFASTYWQEYALGWIVSSVYPKYVSGIQTGRDEFVSKISDEEFSAWIQLLSDAGVDNNSISNKTVLPSWNGFRLEQLRSRLQDRNVVETMQANWLYRPFDVRPIIYDDTAIKRTRGETMRQFLKANIGLITVRQLASQGFAHVFATKYVGDGNTISLNTREYNYFFPLYIYPSDDEKFDDKEKDWPRTNGRRPNLSKAFVAEMERELGLAFVTDGRGDLHHTFGPEDVFHYAYAIFHSPTYRERYAEQLKIDFPRLPLTTDIDLFRQLVACGVDLVALHLLDDDYEGTYWNRNGEPSPLTQPITRFVRGKNGSTVGTMRKSHAYDPDLKRIYLDTSDIAQGSYFEFLDTINSDDAEQTWEFQIGGYQVLHKWLYDRRLQGAEPGRTLTEAELDHYQRVVVALYLTRKLMDDIDTVITEHGGFPLPGSVSDEATVQAVTEEATFNEQEETSMSNQDWREQQPKLIYADGDQLSFADVDEDEDITPPDQAVELTPVSTAEDAVTQMEGFEVEREEVDGVFVEITRPFDPNKIRMTSQQLTLYNLITRMEDNRISIPRYQRAEGIWNEGKQSRLIESILVKIPLPAFYIDATDDENWRIIDGLQRLTTLRRFVIEKTLRLSGLEFLQIESHDPEDKRPGYDDLPRNLQRRIQETPVTVYFVQEGTPPEVTYNIFRRINTGGEALSPQEIRNAVNDGPAVPFLDMLAKSPEFLTATGNSIKALRKADQEVVLRFLAFITAPERRPTTNEIDTFMNDAMKRINTAPESERQALGARFIRAMRAAESILGEYAFRKIMPSGRRGQVSRALFDAWAVNFDELTDQQIEFLSKKRKASRLRGRFKNLLNNDVDFNRAITASTGDPARVQYRYESIKRIINETLEDQ